MPNKVSAKVGEHRIIDHLVARVKAARFVDDMVVAVPNGQRLDDLSCSQYEGSEENVLERFYKCARTLQFDVIVRLTADCPFVPPFEIDRVVKTLIRTEADYVSNRPCVPDGWDVEAFTIRALEKAFYNSNTDFEMEHVTPFMKRCDDLKALFLDAPKLSVDTIDDLEQVRSFYGLEQRINPCDRRNGIICDQFHPVPYREE